MRYGRRIGPSWACAIAMMLAGCGISQPQSVEGLRHVIGDSLPGAQGVTLEDQDKIDFTVARACASRLYDRAACTAHTTASAARRADLAGRADNF